MKNALKLSYFAFFAILLFTLSCNNDDDAVPVTIEDLTVTIDENPTIGQILGTIEVMGTSNPTLSIDTQTPNGALNLDSSTGELTVADASLFDFEMNTVITATISEINAMQTALVTINLNNIEVTIQDLTTTIDENPTTGQILGTIVSNGTGILNYSIMNQAPTGALSIDSNTGELAVADMTLFDFETNPIITASVSDGESTNPATITINLSNILEVSISTFDESVDENPTNGQVLGTVQSNATGNPNYSIVSQTPVGAINIDPNTGIVTVADASLFDHEINQQVDAIIAADDAMDTDDFELQIDNVNEVGDLAFGGVIFWIDPASSNSAGLVVSITNTASGQLVWDCSGTSTGATGTTIGTGQINTSTVSSNGCAATGSLFQVASTTSLNGFNDWFVPSLDEWIEIDNTLSVTFPTIQANNGDTFFGLNWSSSEINATTAYAYALGGTNSNGSSLVRQKTIDYRLRVIRAWTDF